MRIVADTNTVVSGLLWRGAPRKLIDAARARQVTLVTSSALLAELAEVLGRDRFIVRLRQARVSARSLVEGYAGIVHWVDAAPLAGPVARDPDDDEILACAAAAHASAIVSGDDDLVSLRSYQDIPILTAAEALRRIEAGSAGI